MYLSILLTDVMILLYYSVSIHKAIHPVLQTIYSVSVFKTTIGSLKRVTRRNIKICLFYFYDPL
jgi:hypothetical protein